LPIPKEPFDKEKIGLLLENTKEDGKAFAIWSDKNFQGDHEDNKKKVRGRGESPGRAMLTQDINEGQGSYSELFGLEREGLEPSMSEPKIQGGCRLTAKNIEQKSF